jgi:hypothetical protein
MRYVYLINKEHTDEYKIGISNKPEKRLKTIQTGNSEKVIIYEKFSSQYPTKVEGKLHRFFNSERKKGEWFILTDKQVKSFLILCEKYEKNFNFLAKTNIFFQKNLSKLKQ